jgi:hypothetical protein
MNRYRGEITAQLGGRSLTLRLTLQSLAELEHALGAGDAAGLGERLARGRLGSAEVLEILAAGARGGGTPVTAAALGASIPAGELAAATAAAVTLLEASFGAGDEACKEPVPANP